MRVSGAAIDLIAPNEWEDPLPISWIFRYNAMHLRYRARHPARVSIVESEAHAEHIAPNEALAGIYREHMWIIMSTTIKEECADERYVAIIQDPWRTPRPAADVDHADHYRRQPRPLYSRVAA